MRAPFRVGALGSVVAVAVGLPDSAVAQADPIAVDAVMARSVVDRMPQDSATVFPSSVGTVWLWTRVVGAAGQTITHVWRHESREWTVDLQIGGSPWRTFSSKTIAPEWTGRWEVEVRAQDGRVLARRTFTVSTS